MKTIKYNPINEFAVLLVLSLSLGFTACSGDDDGGDNSGYTSPYWTLGSGNANMPSGGTITAQYSDAPAGSEISKLVDNDADTKYLTYHNAFDIIWDGNSNVAAIAYSLTSASDKPEMDPKSWTLSGSMDSKSWEVIDTQDNQSFADRKEVKTYELNNGVAYRSYKLSILTNNGDNATQIAEWVISAASYSGSIGDLMQYSSGNTDSELTPMGSQHANDREASAADLEWLKDPSREPETFAGLSWSFFTVGSLYPYGNPSPADVNQRSVGDCCLEAVMAYIAHNYPGFIKSIIKETGNGTFTVNLYDPKGNPVEVGVSNLFIGDGTNLGASSGKSGQVTWSTVLEKAVIKWKQVYTGSSDVGGIGTEYASAIITGNGSSFAFAPGALSAADLERAVTVSIQQRKIVIGGFRHSDLPIDGKYKSVNGHAYSFFMPTTSRYLFTMRNPWGSAPTIRAGEDGGRDDGLLNIANDGVVPPSIDLRICDPGAARAFAVSGNVETYTPPSFAPFPMRVSSEVLRNPGNIRP